MRKERTKKRQLIWVGLAVAVVLLLLLLLVPKPPVVQTAPAVRGDLVLSLSTTGVVEGNVADVSPRIPGKITQILVEEGDPVRQGQVVARLDTDELQADVDRSRAALLSAETQVSRAIQALAGETRQVNAQIARARAAVAASRARLAELQAGARPQEIGQTQAALRQAEAQSNKAQADLRRAERLFSSGAIARSQLDEAKATAQVAEANVDAARERLALVRAGARREQIAAAQADVRSAEAALAEAQAGRQLLRVREEDVRTARAQVEQTQAALDAAQARLKQATITSPVTGSVVRKQREVGETVNPQQPIITVSRSGPIWVAAEVDQEDVAAIREGQSVRISLDAYPGRNAEGFVTNVSTVAVPKDVGRVRAKVVRARIDVVSSTLPLKPGMEVDIDGQLKAADDVVLVPNDAVTRIGNEDVVYVVNDRTVDRRVVVTGLSNFDYTSIHKGVQAGEKVATSNLDALSDGKRVRVVNEERK